jgi:hypothetical protein
VKFLYAPFGILFGVIGGLIGGAIFKQVWKRISNEEDAPSARESEYGWGEVLPAAALQGAIFAVAKAAVDRGGAKGFQKLTGVWPGD